MPLREECGVFGVYGDPQAAQVVYYGLHSLQHRGQEGAGIVSAHGQQMHISKGKGLMTDVFEDASLSSLPGSSAIGHVRYSTAGGGGYENIQPLLFLSGQGDMAIAHNGELVNALQMKQLLEAQGSIFQSTSDTELLAHMIRRSLQAHFRDKVREALRTLVGGFAFLILTPNEMIAALDRNALRPLCLGKIGSATVVSSESCAFDIIGAQFVRDVEPGEMVVIDHTGIHAEHFDIPGEKHLCSMEYVYFSRPDSVLDGINVHAARKQLGRIMAKENPIEADMVVGVPDSSTSAAIGYAEQSGIPYEMGLIKNRYVGRTFIQPSQEMRERGVRMKLSAVSGLVRGKRLIVLDDSIVRGTTMRRIVQMLREAGAKEVHLRISSPPIKHPCAYGIDMHSYEELISANMDEEALCAHMQADSLRFLSIDGMLTAFGKSKKQSTCGRCTACFNGIYPTPINVEEFI